MTDQETKTKPENIADIVAQYLIDNGYDGLYFDGECACRVGDLFACGEPDCDCKPGYLCDGKVECGGEDFYIGVTKGKKDE